MAPNDLDPHGYVPLWRLLLGRAWLTPATRQQRKADEPAALGPAPARASARCCAETCCT